MTMKKTTALALFAAAAAGAAAAFMIAKRGQDEASCRYDADEFDDDDDLFCEDCGICGEDVKEAARLINVATQRVYE